MPKVCLPLLGRSRNILVAGQRAGGKLVDGAFADHEDSRVPRGAPGAGRAHLAVHGSVAIDFISHTRLLFVGKSAGPSHNHLVLAVNSQRGSRG